MRIALGQINTVVGDLEGNVERCLAAVAAARSQDADLVVLPEMAVPGYPPRDILFDSSFTGAVSEATMDLAERTKDGPPVVVGTLVPGSRQHPNHPGLHNAAVLLINGEVHTVATKRLLPAHDVFFEPRWFLPGATSPPKVIAGQQVGFLVGQDLWDERYDIHPAREQRAAGADALVCLAASPYHRRVLEQRLLHARRQQCPMVYVNFCGGNDELIFDGRSFALNAEGDIIAQLAGFETDLRVIDFGKDTPIKPPDAIQEEELFRALVLGVRDFAGKNRLKHAFLGLSGGVDSAVVAAIACEALGTDGVTAVAIPSRYTDRRSTTCARGLAEALGIRFEVVELEHLHTAAEETLDHLLEKGNAAENVQARLRAMILMSFVNRYGGLLLNTSNKTELSLGYATLYGDAAGTLCPIADLTKPEVVGLARWINSERDVIPKFTLERQPSAELKPDQVDPFDYPKVAPAMEHLVHQNRSDQALRLSEHKRWQMGVILKVSERSFGTGRMIPITRR